MSIGAGRDNNFHEVLDNRWANLHSWLLRLVSDHSTELISIWDHSGQLVYLTPVHKGYYGTDIPRKLQEFDSLVCDDYRDVWYTLLEESTKHKRKARAIYRLSHSSNFVETTIDPLMDKDGKVTCFAVVSKGMTNSAFLEEMLRIEIAAENPFTFFLLELDGLQNIKQNLGPSYSELLIDELLQRLERDSSRNNLIALLQGNEFGLLWKGSHSQQEIKKYVNRIFSLMRIPFLVEGQEIALHASVGISRFPEDGSNKEDMMRRAGIAMASAKEEISNSARTFSRSMGERSSDRYWIERDLSKAVERKELEVYYQPLVNVGSNRVIGLEALLRWFHPQHGKVPPMKFIPIAEESGLMHGISDWVLRRAASDISSLNRRFGTDLFVSINVCAQQFRNDRLLKTIRDILAEFPVRGENIKFEITETLLMKDTETTIQILTHLNQMGIQTFIDDFGTGYSSLSYLKWFPVAGLKIDKSFTAGSMVSEKDKTIINSMTSLAQALNLKVTAEGIETREQLALLEQCGCDYFQGFLFSKPVLIDKLGDLLKVSNEIEPGGSYGNRSKTR